MSNRLEQIIKLKLNNFEIKYPEKAAIEPNPCWEGYEPIGLKDDGSPNCVPIKEEMETVSVDLANYPWEQCIADQIERYGDEETAKKVCGAIKAMYGSKEAFVIPSPESGEDEQKYISRCISDISAEYDQEGQAYAVCKGKWDGK
jgi:hypothetical protein